MRSGRAGFRCFVLGFFDPRSDQAPQVSLAAFWPCAVSTILGACPCAKTVLHCVGLVPWLSVWPLHCRGLRLRAGTGHIAMAPPDDGAHGQYGSGSVSRLSVVTLFMSVMENSSGDFFTSISVVFQLWSMAYTESCYCYASVMLLM